MVQPRNWPIAIRPSLVGGTSSVFFAEDGWIDMGDVLGPGYPPCFENQGPDGLARSDRRNALVAIGRTMKKFIEIALSLGFTTIYWDLPKFSFPFSRIGHWS